MAVGVHRGNGGVTAGPGHSAVNNGQRGHLGDQIRRVALVEIQRGGRHRDCGDVVGIDLHANGSLLIEIDLVVGRRAQVEAVVVTQITASHRHQIGSGGIAPSVVRVGLVD